VVKRGKGPLGESLTPPCAANPGFLLAQHFPGENKDASSFLRELGLSETHKGPQNVAIAGPWEDLGAPSFKC
jgi:hypothetical protein